MTPAHEPSTANLPPGEHLAEWVDVVRRFGTIPWRKLLLEGPARALLAIRAAGCKRACIDGSLITTKEHPGDFDACWDMDGVDFDVIDEALLTLDTVLRSQKAKYRGELFPAAEKHDPKTATRGYILKGVGLVMFLFFILSATVSQQTFSGFFKSIRWLADPAPAPACRCPCGA